jgi:peptide/nickel transport system permease protein
VARRILGRDASPEAVAALNAELGTDRALPVQYWDWISGFLVGDLGGRVASSTA